MQPSPLLTTATFAVFLCAATTASAQRTKHLSETIDSSNLESLKLEISVGELDVEVWEGDEIQLEIDIEADRNWLSFRSRDVSDVELEVDIIGSRAYLEITEDDIEEEWVVRLPAHLAVELEMGVGDVRFNGFANNLELELGVGAVRVDAAGENFESIHASAGVGDASIRGFGNGADNEQNFISADSRYFGDGDYVMNIEVGVGDVQVRAE